jgi:hypothetical protein
MLSNFAQSQAFLVEPRLRNSPIDHEIVIGPAFIDNSPKPDRAQQRVRASAIPNTTICQELSRSIDCSRMSEVQWPSQAEQNACYFSRMCVIKIAL